jgi:hypothetical protein
MRTRLLLPFLLFSGCAWEPGQGFSVLEPTVRAAYTSTPAREAGGGYQQLSSDFQVRLDTASLQVAAIALQGRTGPSGPSRFDPANPPPGYTICHNGHCDREDGVLVPYEEVEAQLGGGASVTTVASLPVGAVDLLSPETRPVVCEPDCELPRTTVAHGRWDITGLRLTGSVRDRRVPPRFAGERPFRLELLPGGSGLTLPVVAINGALDVPSDRESEPRVRLALKLDVTAAVFDSVDWAATQPGADGTVDLGIPAHQAARTALVEGLARLQPQAEVQREER